MPRDVSHVSVPWGVVAELGVSLTLLHPDEVRESQAVIAPMIAPARTLAQLAGILQAVRAWPMSS